MIITDEKIEYVDKMQHYFWPGFVFYLLDVEGANIQIYSAFWLQFHTTFFILNFFKNMQPSKRYLFNFLSSSPNLYVLNQPSAFLFLYQHKNPTEVSE